MILETAERWLLKGYKIMFYFRDHSLMILEDLHELYNNEFNEDMIYEISADTGYGLMRIHNR